MSEPASSSGWPSVRPRAVFFDIGDTLVDARRIRSEAVAATAAWLSDVSKLRYEDIRAELEGHDDAADAADLNKLWGLPLQQWTVLADFAGLPTAVGLQASALYRAEVRKRVLPNPHVADVLKLLSSKDIATGVISDGTLVEQLDTLELLGLRGLFDVIVVSEAVGSFKPSPKIFAVAMAQLERPAPPSRLWYVGDDYERDYRGAVESGWVGVLLHRGQEACPGVLVIESLSELVDYVNGADAH